MDSAGDHARDREPAGGALSARRRNLVAGALLLAAYLVALGLTVGFRSDHVRPLYDGFSTPPAYRWVDPQSFFASGNVEPSSVSTTIKLGPAGSAAAGVATPDGQFVVSLGGGAVAPRSGAKRVAVTIAPVAPRTLAPVPDGLRANGNAYRVEMTYEPSGGKVTRLARPGTLVIEIPELGNDLFTSRGGNRWSRSESRAVPPAPAEPHRPAAAAGLLPRRHRIAGARHPGGLGIGPLRGHRDRDGRAHRGGAARGVRLRTSSTPAPRPAGSRRAVNTL